MIRRYPTFERVSRCVVTVPVFAWNIISNWSVFGVGVRLRVLAQVANSTT